MKTRFNITLTVDIDNGKEKPVSQDEMQDFISGTDISVKGCGGLKVTKVDINSYQRKSC